MGKQRYTFVEENATPTESWGYVQDLEKLELERCTVLKEEKEE